MVLRRAGVIGSVQGRVLGSPPLRNDVERYSLPRSSRLASPIQFSAIERSAAAAAPNLGLMIAAMVLVGALSASFTATTNSSLQLASAPTMRGRVMALWSVAFLGSTAIGGPLAGWVCEEFGGRAGLLLGAVACLVAAGLGAALLVRGRSRALGRVDTTVAEGVA